jgi:polysaccharide export outer membrane protein
MQKGKQSDLVLEQDDVIYIPFSYFRNVASTSSGIVAAATSAAIYTVP